MYGLFCLLAISVQAQKLADSLFQTLKGNKLSQEEIVRTWNSLALELYKTSPDTARLFARGALSLAQKIGNKQQEARAYLYWGMIAQIQGEGELAKNKLNEAVKLFKQLNDLLSEAECYHVLGKVYYNEGDTEKALNYFLQAQEIANKTSDTHLKANSLDNLGIIYNAQRNFIAALDYFFQALSIREKNGDKAGMIISYVNIGQVYADKRDYLRSNAFYNQSLLICQQLNDRYNTLKNLSSLASNYKQMGDFINASRYLERSITLGKQLGDKQTLASMLATRGDLAYLQNQLSNAFFYHQQALELSWKIQSREVRRQAFQGLYLDYKRSGESVKALDYLEKYTSLRDSIFNARLGERINTLQSKYESNKRKNEIQLLKTQSQLNEQKASQTALERNFLFFGFVLVSALLSLLLYGNRQRLATSRQLAYQNEEILRQRDELSKQKEELAEKTQELERLNSTKDKFFSIIAHDLRGPIASFAAFAEIMNSYYEDMTIEEFKNMAQDFNTSVKSLGQLTDNLLTWARAQMSQLEPQPCNLSLLACAEEVIAQLRSVAEDKKVLIQLEPHDAQVFADENYLKFILRNLISNGIKYTPQGGGIIIGYKAKTNGIQVFVADTGVGMSAELLGKLFEPANKTAIKGTAGEGGTGLGLLLCREFIEKMGGKIWAESQIGKGSVFNFTLRNAVPPSLEELAEMRKNKS